MIRREPCVCRQALASQNAFPSELVSPTSAAQETHDMIGLLLMVRINYQHRLIMNRRRIPCLDGYLDRVNLVLWPRFKVRALLRFARLRSQP